MGTHAYKIRAARLCEHLRKAFGLDINLTAGLDAIAAEEGYRTWNVLAAIEGQEPVEGESEILVGMPGCGKTVLAKQTVVEGIAANRPVVIFSPRGEYDDLVRSLGGTIINLSAPDGPKLSMGFRNLLLITWDGMCSHPVDVEIIPKELGFTKPRLKNFVLVVDEAEQRHVLNLCKHFLAAAGANPGAAAYVTVQVLRPEMIETLYRAQIRKARFWRSSYFSALDGLLGREAVEKIMTLPRYESIVADLVVTTAVSNLEAFRNVSDEQIQSVLANCHTKIFLRGVDGAADGKPSAGGAV